MTNAKNETSPVDTTNEQTMALITNSTIQSLLESDIDVKIAVITQLPGGVRVATLDYRNPMTPEHVICNHPAGYPIQVSMPDYLRELIGYAGIKGVVPFGPEAEAAVKGLGLEAMMTGATVLHAETDFKATVYKKK